MNYRFEESELRVFKDHIRQEWVLTNGLGSYSGGSILGALNRTHQGYLIASLHAPVERYLLFAKTNEKIISEGTEYNLEAAMHLRKGHSEYTEGNHFLTSFDYDGTVRFTYKAGKVLLTKSISLVQGENAVAVAYEITNTGEDASLIITPLMNYREHSTNVTAKDLIFDITKKEHGFTLIPKANPDVLIDLGFSRGTLKQRNELFDEDIQLQTEIDNEVDGLDTHFTPFDIEVELPKKTTTRFSLLCKGGLRQDLTPFSVKDDTAFTLSDKQKSYVDSLIRRAGYSDEWASELAVAADQFLVHRTSTGLKTVLAGLPWFTDWGRDTMIAFSGLTLSTKRFSDAREILKTFALYVQNGMVPNMFPDDGQKPLYNTADASLWYFYAVDQYLRYDQSREASDFIQKEIFPSLKEIISAYEHGTLFSIGMDDDGLIHAGSNLDQVTWMDVRVGDMVPTPRHGKPVEINALWYNALCVMESLSTRFREDSSHYRQLADLCRDSFCEKFWNPDTGCLYDVIDVLDDVVNTPYRVGNGNKDDAIRPNQIYAVSLPYSMLPIEKALSVVSVVEDKLYAACGLRSLSCEHREYHPIYLGSLEKRDKAYHQGTAWGFLMGGFITAYMKVHGHNHESAKRANLFLAPVRKHMAEENCIGSICEIFDGDSPHTGRGCYAQAWSVGEVLRCYTEDVLPWL